MDFHAKPTVYIGCVYLKVADLQSSLDFYQGLLGLKVLKQQKDTTFLSADGVNPIVALEHTPGYSKRKERSTGLYHFAFLLRRRSDLAKVLIHLLKGGYPLQGASDHLFSEALYLADPEGNGIEIAYDRPPEDWKWTDGELPFVSEPLEVNHLLATDNGDEWRGFPDDTVLGHIHLHVDHLDTAGKFYCDGLGFDITIPFRNQALFVSSNGYHHHIGLNTWQGIGAPPPSENTTGMKLYSIVFPSSMERQKAADRLQALGYKVFDEQNRLYTVDPAHHLIELAL